MKGLIKGLAIVLTVVALARMYPEIERYMRMRAM